MSLVGVRRALLSPPAKNLAPASNFVSKSWDYSVSANSGPNGANSLKYTGNGVPLVSPYLNYNPIFTISPGVYTLSAWIDLTNATTGQVWVALYDGGFGTEFGKVIVNAGQVGRFSAVCTVPPGYSTAIILWDFRPALTVTNAANILFSQPMLNVGATAKAYVPSSPP